MLFRGSQSPPLKRADSASSGALAWLLYGIILERYDDRDWVVGDKAKGLPNKKSEAFPKIYVGTLRFKQQLSYNQHVVDS